MPEGVQGWDRYGYVNNNPVKYTDPSGHDVGCAGTESSNCNIGAPNSLLKRTGYDNRFHYERGLFGKVKLIDSSIGDQWIVNILGDFLNIATSGVIYAEHGDLFIGYEGAYNKDIPLMGVVIIPGKPSLDDLPTTLTVDDLSKGAALIDRNGLSYAGRALQKHGDRIGSAFPQVVGDTVIRNEAGQLIVDDILTAPGTTFELRTWISNGKSIPVIDVSATTGLGLRFNALTGRLIAFLEP